MATKIKSQQVATNEIITANGRNLVIEDLIRNAGDFTVSEGENNNYLISIYENLVGIEKGDVFKFQANFSNTGPATLQINNFEITDPDTNEQILQIPIQKNFNQELHANDIIQGQIVIVIFDGKKMQLLSPIGDPDNQHTLLEIAGENINGSEIPKALCKIGNNFKDLIFVDFNGNHLTNQGTIKFSHENIPFNQEFGDSADNGLNETSNRIRIAQSFTYPDNPGKITIEKVTLWMQRIGNPGGNIVLEIQEDNGNNIPNDVIIENGASIHKGGGTLPENMEPVVFRFANNPEIQGNQKYHFVLKKIDNQGNIDIIDDNNYYLIARNTENRYPGHGASRFRIIAAGNIWNDLNNDDLIFIIQFNIDGENKVYQTNSKSSVRRNFIGFTQENKQEDENITVRPFGLQTKNFQNLKQSTSYFLNENNGEISENPSSEERDAMIPIGKSLNATSIFTQDGIKNYFISFEEIDAQGAEGDFDFIIPCGFKPQTISISYTIRRNNLERTSVHSINFGPLYKPLGFQNDKLNQAGLIQAGTTAAYSLGNPQGTSHIKLKNYFDNGFTLTFHNANNFHFFLCRILATGN